MTVDHRLLKETVEHLAQEVEHIRQAARSAQQALDVFKDDAWKERGSEAFYAHMGANVYPALRRLEAGLNDARQAAEVLEAEVRRAEQVVTDYWERFPAGEATAEEHIPRPASSRSQTVSSSQSARPLRPTLIPGKTSPSSPALEEAPVTLPAAASAVLLSRQRWGISRFVLILIVALLTLTLAGGAAVAVWNHRQAQGATATAFQIGMATSERLTQIAGYTDTPTATALPTATLPSPNTTAGGEVARAFVPGASPKIVKAGEAITAGDAGLYVAIRHREDMQSAAELYLAKGSQARFIAVQDGGARLRISKGSLIFAAVGGAYPSLTLELGGSPNDSEIELTGCVALEYAEASVQVRCYTGECLAAVVFDQAPLALAVGDEAELDLEQGTVKRQMHIPAAAARRDYQLLQVTGSVNSIATLCQVTAYLPRPTPTSSLPAATVTSPPPPAAAPPPAAPPTNTGEAPTATASPADTPAPTATISPTTEFAVVTVGPITLFPKITKLPSLLPTDDR